ncbi:hypothetical protein ABPG75_011128 [Micractinium tetrahymenae]
MRQRHKRASSGGAADAAAPLPPNSPPRRPPWRKVLWARQEGYSDAHTSESFLEELVVNATVPQRDYATVVWSSLVVDQQLATVAAVGAASHHLYRGSITPRQLLLADALLMLLGSLLYLGSALWAASKAAAAGQAVIWPAGSHRSMPGSPARVPLSPATTEAAAAAAATATALPRPGGSGFRSPSKQPSPHGHHHHHQQPEQPDPGDAAPTPSAAAGWWPRIADGASSLAALAAATALLSPLLGTLTENVSSDSITACACLLLLAHLYLHDYHFSAGLTSQLSGSLALGCAVCSSVLVASRLGSPQAVYAQLLLSLELYILGPYCRRQVAAAAPAAHLALTAVMVAAAAGLLAPLSPLLTSAFGCATLFVTFLCPMWLVRIHKFKAAINGPWDEAVPRLSSAVTRHLSRQ